MDNLLFKDLYKRITKILLSPRLIEKHGLKKENINLHIKSSYFTDTLYYMVTKKDYSCLSTFNLCKNIFFDLGYEKQSEDFLSYVYKYSIHMSFPHAVIIKNDIKLNNLCNLYLKILSIICEFEKKSKSSTWQYKYPINFLDVNETNDLEDSREYKKFIKEFKNNYVYEMMKLSSEVMGFNTLDHVCGVHYLSLHLGRQLKSIDIPIDLGRISGSAAAHDIGKYGCRVTELKRVPHLHYYYTDQWFKKFNLTYIGNVAVNHSTWDLELENLSLESLILIYADFRVKNQIIQGHPKMTIFSLEKSFNIILNKLENVDYNKKIRYKKVYSKLKDFEDYLVNLGIDINLKNNTVSKPNKTYFSLLNNKEITNNIKYISIYHNIYLMYKLRNEYSLERILDTARSEKDWKNLREYIKVFEEYSAYLTKEQKIRTMKFLFENLTHPEDDIRIHCAKLIGKLIATFDEDYRKEIPKDVELDMPNLTSKDLLNIYIKSMLSPSSNTIPLNKFNLGYNTSTMIKSLFRYCRKNLILTYRKLIINHFDINKYKNTDTNLFILDISKTLPLSPYDKDIDKIWYFIKDILNKRNSILRLGALEALNVMIPKLPENYSIRSEIKQYMLDSKIYKKLSTENLLKSYICEKLSLKTLKSKLKNFINIDTKSVTDIFLSNLKANTNWIKKKIQIELILNHSIENPSTFGLHTAIHFCNLLKVSDIESVRNKAGASILKIMPYLTLSERNEVAIELLRALEIEGNRFTEYIPKYTGKVLLWLPPVELEEMITHISYKTKKSNTNLKCLLLSTVGITISNYPKYKERFKENEEIYLNRLKGMLGILLNGLGDYDIQVKQNSFAVIGKNLFGNNLPLKKKCTLYKLISKKLLTLITNYENTNLMMLTISSGLHYIYRFISDYNFSVGKIDIPVSKKIAFFPGTFDPFSSSHKEISKSLRNMGFEVYLAVDEFSWSKQTLPSILRRDLINISIAGELNIYTYPGDMPINIANPNDLKKLKDVFIESEVYIAVGSDVVLNASSYKIKNIEIPNSIFDFSHIIFKRGSVEKLSNITKYIKGEVVYFSLSSKFSNISSTRIRKYIDENKSISSLVDPVTENYIYEKGFYQRESQDKAIIKPLPIRIRLINPIDKFIINEMIYTFQNKIPDIEEKLMYISSKPSCRMIIIRNTQNKLIGFSIFHWIRSTNLYEEMKDSKITNYIRKRSTGRMLSLDGFYLNISEKNRYLEQILLTETLALCISKDYEYAVFNPISLKFQSSSILELLELQGFIQVPTDKNNNKPIYSVDMSTPSILNLDIESVIKSPYRHNKKIKNIILETRKSLRKALVEIYKGQLILSFDNNFLHQCMINKICNENNVPTTIQTPRVLGDCMCVPYGNILDKYITPNTVTKALHTEKMFFSDVKHFKIGEAPHYLNLKSQVKMLKSFNRPIILADNLLHKGYRIKKLDPIFKKENVKIQKIIVGIMSGRGKDLMDKQNRSVDSAYFIPRLKLWFNEADLYPFIGGNLLWRGKYPKRNLLPSVNLILPYTYPKFITNTDKKNIFNLSKISIENSIKILSALEEEYHNTNDRNLTLSLLGHVFNTPRCPDQGNNIYYNLNLMASHYLNNDYESLLRLENIFE